MAESRLLDEFERRSALWLKIAAGAETRLAILRERNDRRLTAEETARLRGQIAEVKYLISLGAEQQALPPEDEKFKD